MNKQAFLLIEKILKSGKYQIGVHNAYCNTFCIYKLFEEVHSKLTGKAKVDNCLSNTKVSTKYILDDSLSYVYGLGNFSLKNGKADKLILTTDNNQFIELLRELL